MHMKASCSLVPPHPKGLLHTLPPLCAPVLARSQSAYEVMHLLPYLPNNSFLACPATVLAAPPPRAVFAALPDLVARLVPLVLGGAGPAIHLEDTLNSLTLHHQVSQNPRR
jgi:hypothetical protein